MDYFVYKKNKYYMLLIGQLYFMISMMISI